ncbi:MAG TPA: hypothetical protein VEL75_04890 [Candidatus Methylomirabilis sp.]|nr:hypothetical protein [Candidatus Methylomirabilis sp.]
MVTSLRRSAPIALALVLALLAAGVDPVGADHGGLSPVVKLSPLAVGVLAGVLALTAGIAIFAIVMLLTKKPRRSE